MDKGGERVEREGDENTGWESVAELASQAPDKSQELGMGVGAENSLESLSEEEIVEQLNVSRRREVFEKVNLRKVAEVVGEALQEIDGEELLDLQQEMKDDLSKGIAATGEYYTRVLGLDRQPILREKELPDKEYAKCELSVDGMEDIIYFDVSGDKGNVEELLLTIGHESWHCWQHQEVRAYYDGRGKWQSALYAFNENNYIAPEDDYEGYRSQLVEEEAYTLEMGLEKKIRWAKMKRIIEKHPEIYGEENMEGIEREMQEVFHGFDVGNFLEEVGVPTVNDLIKKVVDGDDKTEIERMAGRYMGYLTDLAGVESKMKVRLEEDLGKAGTKAILIDKVGIDEIKIFSDMLVIQDEVLLGKNMEDYSDIFLREMPRLVWRLRQNELMKDDPDNERAQLYAMNKENFVTDKYDSRLATKQLLVREQNEFADTLMGILDEQATIEEVEQMPLPKRVLAKMHMMRKDVLYLSKKYQVKRSK